MTQKPETLKPMPKNMKCLTGLSTESFSTIWCADKILLANLTDNLHYFVKNFLKWLSHLYFILPSLYVLFSIIPLYGGLTHILACVIFHCYSFPLWGLLNEPKMPDVSCWSRRYLWCHILRCTQRTNFLRLCLFSIKGMFLCVYCYSSRGFHTSANQHWKKLLVGPFR